MELNKIYAEAHKRKSILLAEPKSVTPSSSPIGKWAINIGPNENYR